MAQSETRITEDIGRSAALQLLSEALPPELPDGSLHPPDVHPGRVEFPNHYGRRRPSVKDADTKRGAKQWQLHAEGRSDRGPVHDLECAAHLVHEVPADREPETGSGDAS